MAEVDAPKRPYVSRIKFERINEIHRLMGLGKRTYLEIAEAKKGEKGWSLRSIERLVTSPEMEVIRRQIRDETENYVTGLVKRQQDQIENGGLAPGSQLAFRQKIIELYKPRDVKVTGQINQKIEVDKPVITVEDLIGEYGDVILDEVLRRRLQGDRGDSEEDTGKPMDPKTPSP